MTREDIIFFAVEPYEHYVPERRRHQVARRLVKKNRVLWVAPPIPFIGLLFPKHYNLTHYSFKTLFNLGRLKYQGCNLWVYCPVQFFPTWYKIPFIYKINKLLIFKALQSVVKRLNFRNPILWLYKNRCDYEYYGLFNEKMIIYDCYDIQMAFQGFNHGDAWLKSVLDWESKAIEKADIVFTVSKKLYNDFAKIKKKTHLIPNGVDYDFFQSNKRKGNNINLMEIRKPILGHHGIYHYKLDFELLNYLAENRPSWSILLIGKNLTKVSEDRSLFEKLINRENVYYTGVVSLEQLPLYLQGCDLFLMPMKRLEFNRYADPLKLWEYLAVGKPIVAVDQGVEYQYQHLIKVAPDKEGFVRCVEESLCEDNSELVAERKRVARENSWDKRVDRMMELIEAELQHRVH